MLSVKSKNEPQLKEGNGGSQENPFDEDDVGKRF